MNSRTQVSIGRALNAGTTERGTDSIRTAEIAGNIASIYRTVNAGTTERGTDSTRIAIIARTQASIGRVLIAGTRNGERIQFAQQRLPET